MRIRNSIFFILCVAIFVSGCDFDNTVTAEENDYEPIELSFEQKEIVDNGNSFALTLLDAVMTDKSDSFIISPISLQFILGMLLNGAEEETAAEIRKVLCVTDYDNETINNLFCRLIQDLPTRDKLTDITGARIFFTASNYPLKSEYTKVINNTFGAVCETMDFTNVSFARKSINQWCSSHTNGMIPEMVSKDEESSLCNVAGLLMDAIWFKGVWKDPFEKSNTAVGQFLCANGTTSSVKYMATNNLFGAYGGECFTAVTIPYGNGSYSMDVLLPDEGKRIQDILLELNRSYIEFKDLYNVDLKLPKFSIETSLDFLPILEKASAIELKKAEAFTPMFAESPAALSAIKQKTAIETDETGTKATSVTSASFVAAANLGSPLEVEKLVFHASRSFIYMIRERSTNAILFAGVYNGK